MGTQSVSRSLTSTPSKALTNRWPEATGRECHWTLDRQPTESFKECFDERIFRGYPKLQQESMPAVSILYAFHQSFPSGA